MIYVALNKNLNVVNIKCVSTDRQKVKLVESYLSHLDGAENKGYVFEIKRSDCMELLNVIAQRFSDLNEKIMISYDDYGMYEPLSVKDLLTDSELRITEFYAPLHEIKLTEVNQTISHCDNKISEDPIKNDAKYNQLKKLNIRQKNRLLKLEQARKEALEDVLDKIYEYSTKTL